MLQHLLPEHYIISRWSGGTTTQIAISPGEANYSDRTFLWRVSSAQVELDASDFTPLPDYLRYIAVLQGEMTLCHNGGPLVSLVPGQVHAFDGGDQTHSEGRCTDFNLMLRKDACNGCLEAIHLPPGSQRELKWQAPRAQMLLYCYQGQASVTVDTQYTTLTTGQSLLLDETDIPVMTTGPEPAAVMAAQMWACP